MSWSLGERLALSGPSQRLQYPLIQEYALNHVWDSTITYGTFTSGMLGSLGELLRSVHRHVVSAPDNFGVVFFQRLLKGCLSLAKSNKDMLIAEVGPSQGQAFRGLA